MPPNMVRPIVAKITSFVWSDTFAKRLSPCSERKKVFSMRAISYHTINPILPAKMRPEIMPSIAGLVL